MLSRGVTTLCRFSLPRTGGFTLCQPARCVVRLYTKENGSGNSYADQLMEASDSFLQQKNFDQATTTLRKLVEIDPANVRAYSNLAAVLMMQNRFDLAKPIVEKALSLDPNNVNNVTNMASCLMKEEKYSDALPYLERATDLNPKFWRALFNLSNVYLALQRSDDALAVIRRARAVNDREPNILLTYMTVLRVRIAEAEEQLLALSTQTATRSTMEETRVNQQMFADLKEFLELCNEAIESNNLVVVEKMRKECDVLLLAPRYSAVFAKAMLPTLEKASAVFPQHIPLLVNCSMASFVTEDITKATTYIKSAIALDPKNVGLYQLFGEVSFNYIQKRMNPEETTKAKSATISSKQPELTEAQMHLLQQNVFSPLKEALQVQPNLPRANYILGRACWLIGDLVNATTYFQRVIELEPQHESAHRDLGKLSYERGLLDDAANHFENALRIAPVNAKFHFEYFLVLLRRQQENTTTTANRSTASTASKQPPIKGSSSAEGIEPNAKAMHHLETAAKIDPKAYAPVLNHATSGGRFNVQDFL